MVPSVSEILFHVGKLSHHGESYTKPCLTDTSNVQGVPYVGKHPHLHSPSLHFHFEVGLPSEEHPVS